MISEKWKIKCRRHDILVKNEKCVGLGLALVAKFLREAHGGAKRAFVVSEVTY
jgi:hypothetical protein